jgi:nitroreductase
MQRRAFVICHGRENLAALSRVGDYAGHLAGAAVGIAIVTPEPESPGQAAGIFYDVGLAAQNMSLAAWDLGIGSAPATVLTKTSLASSWATPRVSAATTSCRSAILPTRPS